MRLAREHVLPHCRIVSLVAGPGAGAEDDAALVRYFVCSLPLFFFFFFLSSRSFSIAISPCPSVPSKTDDTRDAARNWARPRARVLIGDLADGYFYASIEEPRACASSLSEVRR
jgi:hypothetical protein